MVSGQVLPRPAQRWWLGSHLLPHHSAWLPQSSPLNAGVPGLVHTAGEPLVKLSASQLPLSACWGHLHLRTPSSALNLKAPDGVHIQLSGHLSASAKTPWLWSRSRGSPMVPCTSPGHPEADLDTARPGLPTCMFDSSTPGSPGLTGFTGMVSGSEIL